MESAMETLQQLLMKKKNYPELKESIRMMKTQLKEIIWLRKVKENILIKLLEKKHKVKKMLSYCLKSRKNTKNIKRNISGTSNGKTMVLSNCAICASR